MARISGCIRIAAPVERVFDTAADSRNEPSFNPAMTGVELLTPLPIGLGTRFRMLRGFHTRHERVQVRLYGCLLAAVISR
jgi:hypothetical protein